MKNKIFSVCLMLSFIITCSLSFFACNDNKPLLNLSIANYAHYESIVIGSHNNLLDSYSVSTNNKKLAKSQSNNQRPQLLGKLTNGEYKEVDFEEDTDLTSYYAISAVKNLNDFLILVYSKDYYGDVKTEIQTYSSDDYMLALYKPTGKIFDITQYKINVYTQGIYSISNNSFFTISNDSRFILKFTVINNKLEIKEIVDRTKVSAFNSYYISDKYGNIYSLKGNQDYQYMITTKGLLKKLDENIKIGVNGIAYINNKWINAQGELEDATFIPTDWINPLMNNFGFQGYNNLIYKENNDFYYRLTLSNGEKSNEIIKISFKDDIQYTIEKIQLEKYEKDSGVIVRDRIYFLKDSEVYYVNIKDGSYISLNSDYLFNKIYTNNQGDIIFEGVDNYLNEITGVILQNGSIVIGIEPKEYTIFYVDSLN